MNHSDHGEELQELGHEPWPGYRQAFLVVFPLFTLYLALIFVLSGMGTVGGHH